MTYDIISVYYDDVIVDGCGNHYAQDVTHYPTYKAAVKAYYRWYEDSENGYDPCRKYPDFPIKLEDRIRHMDLEYCLVAQNGKVVDHCHSLSDAISKRDSHNELARWARKYVDQMKRPEALATDPFFQHVRIIYK